jgi:hypothetical protein
MELLSELEVRVETLEDDYKQLVQVDYILQNQITALAEADVVFANDINELNGNFTSLSQQVTLLNQDVNVLQSVDITLQTEIDSLSTDVLSIQTQFSNWKSINRFMSFSFTLVSAGPLPTGTQLLGQVKCANNPSSYLVPFWSGRTCDFTNNSGTDPFLRIMIKPELIPLETTPPANERFDVSVVGSGNRGNGTVLFATLADVASYTYSNGVYVGVTVMIKSYMINSIIPQTLAADGWLNCTLTWNCRNLV